MSKKNTPISIYKNDTNFNKIGRFFKRLNSLHDKKFYTINGVEYAEEIDTDMANGNLGRSTLIQKFVVEGGEVKLVKVTDKETLDMLASDPTRSNVIGAHLNDWLAIDGAEEALKASGMYEVAKGDQSWVGAIPLPSNQGGDATNTDKDSSVVTPAQIFGGYKEIFNKHLKYPMDMFIGGEDVDNPTEGSQDYIFIEQFLYKAPQKGAGYDKSKYVQITEGDRAGQLEDTTGLLGRTLEQGVSRGSNIQGDPIQGDPRGSCILPIPNRLDVSQGVNWGEGKANAVELGAFQAVSGATRNLLGKDKGGLVKLIADGYNQGKSVFNTVSQQMSNADGTANAGAVINAVIAKSVLGRVGINVDTEQFITRETGAAINPNLELLFGGPQLRTFSFAFNFAPNGTEEAKVVRQIQRWFRQGMLPQKTTNFNNGGSLFLGSPNVFRICYKNNKRRIKGLNTFKICACTSVEIDFTPDGVYQSYEDKDANSMPVRSTMKVTFNELTPIFANDYNDFEDPSVKDLGLNVTGDNKFTEDDLGF